MPVVCAVKDFGTFHVFKLVFNSYIKGVYWSELPHRLVSFTFGLQLGWKPFPCMLLIGGFSHIGAGWTFRNT